MKKSINVSEIQERLKSTNIIINNPVEYINTSTPVKCTCLKTGYGRNGEWEVSINRIFTRNSCCPICGKNKRTKQIDQIGNDFRINIDKFMGKDYSFTGNINRRKNLILGEIKHEVCGRLKYKTLADVKDNIRCIKCTNGKNQTNSLFFKGCGEIPKRYYTGVRSGAFYRNLEFDVTIEFLWDLFLKQNRKCALSGEEIQFGINRYSATVPAQTASLDRINSSEGYTENNVQWIHKDINKMKQNFDEKIFIDWCEKITKFVNRNHENP